MFNHDLIQNNLFAFSVALHGYAFNSSMFFSQELLNILSHFLQIENFGITIYENRQLKKILTTSQLIKGSTLYIKSDFIKRDYLAKYIGEHLDSLLLQDEYPVITSKDNLGQSKLEQLEYDTFFAKHGIRTVIVLPMSNTFRIAFYLKEDLPFISDDSRKLFSTIGALIKKYYEFHMFRHFSESSFSLLGNYFDSMNIGYVVFRSSYEFLKTNQTAMEYLSDIANGFSVFNALNLLMKHFSQRETFNIREYELNIYRTPSEDFGSLTNCILINKSKKIYASSQKTTSVYPFHSLSQREAEILDLFSKGASYLEISNLLCISEGTIKTHLKNIYRKLNISNQRKLIYEYLSYADLSRL